VEDSGAGVAAASGFKEVEVSMTLNLTVMAPQQEDLADLMDPPAVCLEVHSMVEVGIGVTLNAKVLAASTTGIQNGRDISLHFYKSGIFRWLMIPSFHQVRMVI